MGRKLNKHTSAEAGNTGPLANVADRREAISTAFDKIFDIEQDIDAAREKHLKPLTDERTKLWRQLKADTGIERADLEPFYKVHKRNQYAAGLEGDEAQHVQDNLREVFFAMQKGEQLDFIGAMQDA